MPSSIGSTMYRQLAKKIGDVSAHYKHSPEHVAKALFGLAISANDFSAAGLGNTPKEILRSYFVQHSTEDMMEKSFWLLRQIPAATPNKKFDDRYIFRPTVIQLSAQHPPRISTVAEEAKDEGKTGDGEGSKHQASSGKKEKTMELRKGESQEDKEILGSIEEFEKESSTKSKEGLGDDDEEEESRNAKEMAGRLACASKTVRQNVRALLPLDGFATPLPKHAIPNEPFYVINTTKKDKFPFCKDLLELAAAKAKRRGETIPTKDAFFSVPTETSTLSHSYLEVVCRTRFIGKRTKTPTQEEDGDTSSEEDEYCFQYIISIRNLGEPASSSKIREHQESDSTPTSVAEEQLSPKEIERRKLERKLRKQARREGLEECLTSQLLTPPAKTMLLLSRHWMFFDLDKGTVHEVAGPGVIGSFPCLAGGEAHTYASGTTMSGKRGLMKGTFQMVLYDPKGGEESLEFVDANIGLTRLDALA